MSTPSPSASPPAGSGDSERRSRLLGIKLRALVGDHLGDHLGGTAAEPRPFPNGAALVADGAAWVLVDGSAVRSLGHALAWALRSEATSLHIVADHDTGLLARRATRFRFPIRVWFAEGRVLLPAVAEPLATPAAALPEHLELVPAIEAAGATPSVEHGVVVGEVRGLEVCRVVAEPTVGHVTELGDFDPALLPGDADGVLLEVGVGPNDREAFRMLHGDIPTVEALGAVVESVLAYRSADAPQHPLNRLGQERYVRWQLEQEPGRVGMVSIEGAEPPLPRANLKDPVPCVATATDADGELHHVVCSVGVDVDLVGFVADVQTMVDTPVIVALRERDAVAITREMLAQLLVPVEIRTV
jgi:hypothetical protein